MRLRHRLTGVTRDRRGQPLAGREQGPRGAPVALGDRARASASRCALEGYVAVAAARRDGRRRHRAARRKTRHHRRVLGRDRRAARPARRRAASRSPRPRSGSASRRARCRSCCSTTITVARAVNDLRRAQGDAAAAVALTDRAQHVGRQDRAQRHAAGHRGAVEPHHAALLELERFAVARIAEREPRDELAEPRLWPTTAVAWRGVAGRAMSAISASSSARGDWHRRSVTIGVSRFGASISAVLRGARPRARHHAIERQPSARRPRTTTLRNLRLPARVELRGSRRLDPARRLRRSRGGRRSGACAGLYVDSAPITCESVRMIQHCRRRSPSSRPAEAASPSPAAHGAATRGPAQRARARARWRSMPPEIAKFHDVLAPRWHAEKGPQRMKDTCAAIPDFTRAWRAREGVPPTGMARRWTNATQAARRRGHRARRDVQGERRRGVRDRVRQAPPEFHGLIESGEGGEEHQRVSHGERALATRRRVCEDRRSIRRIAIPIRSSRSGAGWTRRSHGRSRRRTR